MDAETWNEKLQQLVAAGQRSQRMLAIHTELQALAHQAHDLGAPAQAAQLADDCFRLATIAQDYEGRLHAELDAARAAGEEPD